jgi:hypothetical protein
LLEYDTANLAQEVESLSEDEVNALPFGAIRLNAEGLITYYSGRIAQALLRGTLDLEFTHIGDFEDRNRELTVRVQSASGGGYWIFMQRT